MDLVAKKITGDWMELRDKMTSPNRVKGYLRVEDYALGQVAEALKHNSVEGILSFKRKMISHLFSFLSKLSRSTPSQGEVIDEETHLRSVLFAVCIENLFALGSLKTFIEPSQNTQTQANITVTEVFQELQKLIAQDPEVAKDPLAKTILLDLQQYKKEFAAFSQLSPNITDDRAPAFFLNFKGKIDNITQNANTHYRELLFKDQHDTEKNDREKLERLLANTALSNILTTQAQELSRIRSSLSFAAQEGYKFRDILLRLLNKKDQIMALFDEEERILQSMVKSGEPSNSMAVRMTRSLADFYENHLLKKDSHPAR